MHRNLISIDNMLLDIDEIQSFHIEHKTIEAISGPDNKNHEDNHYLTGLFSLLIAGLVSQFLRWRMKQKSGVKILTITTRQGGYAFTEDQVNVNRMAKKLRQLKITEN